MSIHTTFYIKSNLLVRLIAVSSSLNISVNSLVVMLIIKMIKRYIRSKPVIFSTVKYQKTDDDNSGWKIQHLSLDVDVYEKAVDLRKVFKKTVSLIIAIAIEKYLDEIVRELSNNKKSMDNYLHNYLFISSVTNGIFNFTIYNSIPPQKILKNHFEKH